MFYMRVAYYDEFEHRYMRVKGCPARTLSAALKRLDKLEEGDVIDEHLRLVALRSNGKTRTLENPI